MSSIDPRQAALRAAEEARRRATEDARRSAAERAREQARARELAQRLSSALESRPEPETREVARVLRDAESLGPDARARFLEEAGPRAGRASGAGAAEALRARIAELFPEASDARRQLGEALAGLRGQDPRGRSRESLESLVSEALSRLDVRAGPAPPARAVTPASGDHLERAPDVSLFGGGPRPVRGVRPEPGAMPRPPGPSRADDVPRDVRGAVPLSRVFNRPASDPSISRLAEVDASSPLPTSARTPPADAVRSRTAEVALDREDLAAALGMGQPRVIERATPSPPSVDLGDVSDADAPRAEAVGNERAEFTKKAGEGFFARLRQALVLTPSVAEAVVAPGVRAVGAPLEVAARSLGRAREAIADGSRENVRVQYGLHQARGLFDKIAAHLERTQGLVAHEIVPTRVAGVRPAATAARDELDQVQLGAGEARRELGEVADWARQVGVRSVLRDVSSVANAAGCATGELRNLGGRGEVLASLETGAVSDGQVHQSDGGTGIPPHAAGGGVSPPDLAAGAPPPGIPADFTFGEEDLARIGTGLDPSQLPPQNYWSEAQVNTLCELGRQQGGVTAAEGHGHFLLAGQLLEGAEGQAIELGAAEIALALKAAGIPLEKVDPNQLHSAARYVNTATDAVDQREKLRKTLDSFKVLTTTGAPPLTRHEMGEQLWAVARVPGHALENLSDTELRGKHQEILAAVNSGPGRVELRVGKHNLTFTVGPDGQVTDSECKKPGFFSRLGGFLKKVAPIALTVASFIPFTAPFARIAQGAISLVKAIRSRSILGAVTSAAGVVAGGATALAGRLASGAAGTAAQVARIANGAARGLQGVSSIRQGSILGGIAALGSGVADAIGRAAEGAATGLQRFANGLGDVSAKLSYAARGIGIVDGYRAASGAVNAARVALRQAEASGDPAAIAAARQQLEVAEKAKSSALLGGAASAAGLAADVRSDHTIFPGAPSETPIPQGGLDRALRGASRGLSVAQGVQSGDYASAGVNALGLAAVGRAATGGESPAHLGLTDAANLADAALGYYQTNRGLNAAERAVTEAEAALDAAHRSGDAVAIQAAEANLDQARRAREGALMGAIGAGDGLMQTSAVVGEKRHELARVEHLRQMGSLRGEQLLAVLQDPRTPPRHKQEAMAALLHMATAGAVYESAVRSGDPAAIREAREELERLDASLRAQPPGTILVASLGVRDVEPSPASPESESEEGWDAFWGGVFYGDFDDNDSWSKLAGQILVGIVPYAGQAADVRDTAAALNHVREGRPGAWIGLLAAGIGWVPGAGDAIKGAIRGGRKAAGEVVEEGVEQAVRVARESAEEASEAAARSGTHATGHGIVPLDRAGFVAFQGLEVRGLRELSHVPDSTLKAMSEFGFAATDAQGNRLVLHHLDQNPLGPVVEMPARRHSIGNPRQHPFGNAPGAGLTAEQRAAFNVWRVEYWKARATAELSRRGIQ